MEESICSKNAIKTIWTSAQTLQTKASHQTPFSFIETCNSKSQIYGIACGGVLEYNPCLDMTRDYTRPNWLSVHRCFLLTRSLRLVDILHMNKSTHACQYHLTTIARSEVMWENHLQRMRGDKSLCEKHIIEIRKYKDKARSHQVGAWSNRRASPIVF